MQYPQKINVWARINDNKIIGSYFGNLTGEQFGAFQEWQLISELVRLFPYDVNPNLGNTSNFFQHDRGGLVIFLNHSHVSWYCISKSLDWKKIYLSYDQQDLRILHQ